MSDRLKHWLKPSLALALLALLTWLAPAAPLDPWHLMNPKKVATMIFALAVVQVFGSLMAQYLGARTGALLTGFLGGLVSSTATTASLARRSQLTGTSSTASAMLMFLAATSAMLIEGLVLVTAGLSEVHWPLLLIFVGPLFATGALILIQSRQVHGQVESSKISEFEVLPILKLAVFILVIISISKILQNYFGKNGIVILTSLVSLFEIHGSIIANVQMHESGSSSTLLLCGLLAISVAASYVSKLFLILTIGSSPLRLQALKATALLFCASGASWGFAFYFLELQK
ncbi:MAG: DUF4010 domain-containing protein [Bdellovibrio sp.]|jgi:uncharacterized membrane protein (DUF4010 family)